MLAVWVAGGVESLVSHMAGRSVRAKGPVGSVPVPQWSLPTPPQLHNNRRSFFHCGILVPCLEFCCAQVLAWQRPGSGAAPAAAAPLPPQFVVQCLLLIHGVQRCGSYKGSASSLSLHSGARSQLEQLKGLAAEVQPALGVFWSAARLQAFVAATVERLLPLTDKELQEW